MEGRSDTSTRGGGSAPGALPIASVERPLSLRLNFFWTLAGNVIYAGCQWGTLILLAKLVSPEEVGRFALGLAVTAPIILFSNLQLRGIQATDATGEYAFVDYLGLRILSTVLALVVIGGVVWIVGYSPTTSAVIIALGIAKAAESMSDVVYGLFQQRERMDRIARSMIMRGVLSLVAVGGLVVWTGEVFAGACGLAATWGLVFWAYDLPKAKLMRTLEGEVHTNLSPRFELGRLRGLFLLAFPLGIVMMMVSLNTNVPRYLIERANGTSVLGFYTALTYLTVVGGTVVAALGQTASPRMAKLFADGRTGAFVAVLGTVTGISIAGSLIGVILSVKFGEIILKYIYTLDYALYSYEFVWIMIAGAVAYISSVLGYGVTSMRKFKIQIPISIMSVSLISISGWILIPRFGIIGAAWATMIAFGVQIALKVGLIAYVLRCDVRKVS